MCGGGGGPTPCGTCCGSEHERRPAWLLCRRARLAPTSPSLPRQNVPLLPPFSTGHRREEALDPVLLFRPRAAGGRACDGGLARAQGGGGRRKQRPWGEARGRNAFGVPHRGAEPRAGGFHLSPVCACSSHKYHAPPVPATACCRRLRSRRGAARRRTSRRGRTPSWRTPRPTVSSPRQVAPAAVVQAAPAAVVQAAPAAVVQAALAAVVQAAPSTQRGLAGRWGGRGWHGCAPRRLVLVPRAAPTRLYPGSPSCAGEATLGKGDLDAKGESLHVKVRPLLRGAQVCPGHARAGGRNGAARGGRLTAGAGLLLPGRARGSAARPAPPCARWRRRSTAGPA